MNFVLRHGNGQFSQSSGFDLSAKTDGTQACDRRYRAGETA